jgi:hypothetical protein
MQYRGVREALAPSLRGLPNRAIETVFAAQGLQARAVEDFWDSLGNVVASALPVVGGAVGSIIAPGVGTAIGAGLGSAAGGALHSAIGSGQNPAPPNPTYPAAPYQVPGQAVSSQQASAQLLQLLSQPQLLQALIQMLMGGAGSPTVPVRAPAPPGTAAPATAVPVSAFTNLLSTLATQASEAYNAERGFSSSPAPFQYGAGPFGSSVDLASPESRAEALMNLLRESNGARAAASRQNRVRKVTELVEALRIVNGHRA